MRLIDADALIRRLAYYHAHSYGKAEYAYGVAAEEVNKLPTIDAVPVVRCKDCKLLEPCLMEGDDFSWCNAWNAVVGLNGFCYKGAKMDGGAEDGDDT